MLKVLSQKRENNNRHRLRAVRPMRTLNNKTYKPMKIKKTEVKTLQS